MNPNAVVFPDSALANDWLTTSISKRQLQKIENESDATINWKRDITIFHCKRKQRRFKIDCIWNCVLEKCKNHTTTKQSDFERVQKKEKKTKSREEANTPEISLVVLHTWRR
mmetsp:Transcript_26905/g.48533  ORF Transcript_26905/g.48533 Transcript_26905/m.48533 type:complete len:112 (+) Transcript_26905:575-910(+)